MLRLVLSIAMLACFGYVLPAIAADLPLVFEDNFENGADNWQPTDAKAWKVNVTDQGKVYEQFKMSNYKPPHRSPFNISLLKDVVVGDFVLTSRVKSTTRDYGHRDVCIIFGYQDPAHFYYAHMGKKADPYAGQIMIVNDAPRKMITKNESPGVPWTDDWHSVKIVRRVADGTIEVYFDNMEKPIMIAEDKTFASGRIGLGSFDDTAQWDQVELRGQKVDNGK